MARVLTVLRQTSLEAYLWMGALLVLALTDPSAERLLRICPLDLLDVSWCPGCGLGRAIAHLFRGEVLLSFHMHPLALPAVVILSGRIVRLFADATQRTLSLNQSR